jgi:hypothetical protein
MNGKDEGRHRAGEVPLAETTISPVAGDNEIPLTPDLPGQFSVQLLDGHWFIGPIGAVQRIEDARWLQNWLAANGTNGPDVLDFAGDHELRQRFLTELASGPPSSIAPSNGESA